MTEQMNMARLATILEAYGASTDRWPETERAAAMALLSRSPDAQALVEEAAQLDLLLKQLPAVETPSAILLERLMAARPRSLPSAAKRQPSKSASWGSLWPYGSIALPTSALAFSMMLGVVLGTVMQGQTVGASSVTSSDTDQLVTLALAETAYPEEWKP
jgi:hypothetical protein